MLGWPVVRQAARIIGMRSPRAMGAVRGAAGAVAAHGVQLLVAFFAIPISYSYLGTAEYGLWLTLGNVLVWLSLCDIGLTNSLTNALSEAFGHDDRDRARQLFGAAIMLQGAIIVALLGLVALLARRIPWAAMLGASKVEASTDLSVVIPLAIAAALLGLQFQVAAAVFRAYRDSYINHAWAAAATLASLAALVGVTYTELGLLGMVLAFFGLRAAFQFAALVHALVRYPWMRGWLQRPRGEDLGRLSRVGAFYLVAQVVGLIMHNSENLILSHAIGVEAVPSFAVTMRLMTLPQVGILLLTLALLPAYSEAKARGDWAWIWRTFRRTSLGGALMGLGVLPIALVVSPFITWWMGGELVPSVATILWLSVRVMLDCVLTPAGTLLYGLERPAIPALAGIANSVILVLGGYWGSMYFGPAGLAAAMALGLLLAMLPSMSYDVWVVFRRTCGRNPA